MGWLAPDAEGDSMPSAQSIRAWSSTPPKPPASDKFLGLLSEGITANRPLVDPVLTFA